MPRKYEMNYDGAPNYRWRKMHKGVSYSVKCEELEATVWTKEGSGKLANEWWRKKIAEIEGKPADVKALESIPDIESLKRMIEAGQAARAILKEMPYKTPDRETIDRLLGFRQDCGEVPSDVHQRADMVEQVVRKVNPAAAPADRQFKAAAEGFLALVKGDMKASSYRDLCASIRQLYPQYAAMDVGAVNEDFVQRVFVGLRDSKLANGVVVKRWQFFTRLVEHFWSMRLCELPRNLKTLHFAKKRSARIKQIKRYDTPAVRNLLSSLPERHKLYAMLAINCGMYAADIGRLRKDMVDLDAGRLVRKRTKTEDVDDVPVVNYALWPETVALLRKYWSKDDTLALTSDNGGPLWVAREKATVNLIYQMWSRNNGYPIPFKAFRSIGSSLLEDSDEHRSAVLLYGGWSPRSIKDKHYAAPSQRHFDRAILWLREQVIAEHHSAGLDDAPMRPLSV
jgi:integrase